MRIAIRVLLFLGLAILGQLPLAAQVSCAHPSIMVSGSATIGQSLIVSLFRNFFQTQMISPVITSDVDNLHHCVKATLADASPFVAFIRADGTNRGVSEYLQHQCDVVMASRRVPATDFGGAPFREIPICVDALSIIVNPENPIKSLNIDQLYGIFTGKITDWSEVSDGEFSGKIRVYSQPSATGTADMFRTLALKGGYTVSSALEMVDQTSLSSSVSVEPFAIGYVGMAFIGESKALFLSPGAGRPAVPASPTTLLNEEYPLMRQLYLYAKEPLNPVFDDFVKYIISSEKAQEVIVNDGFTPLSPFLQNKDARANDR